MAESPATSGYPGALDTWTTLTDKQDRAEVSDINKIKAALLAIETELGTDPAGSDTDLKTRLTAQLDNDGGVLRGTSFPGSPQTYQTFFRTDSNTFYVYNGSTWVAAAPLSNCLYTWGGTDAQVFSTANATSAAATEVWMYAQRQGASTAYLQVLKSKFKKISGVNTVTWYALTAMSSTVNTDKSKVKVDVGGQNSEAQQAASSTTPEWLTNTIDVSGLTNGTVYDIAISLGKVSAGNGTEHSNLFSIILFGS